jgi:hypothetical protein
MLNVRYKTIDNKDSAVTLRHIIEYLLLKQSNVARSTPQRTNTSGPAPNKLNEWICGSGTLFTTLYQINPSVC